jgi:hypothetical protein
MKRHWTADEDQLLMHLVSVHGKQWGVIASHMPRRSASHVSARWEKCLDPHLTKGPFTQEEDQALANHVAVHGPRNWPAVSALLGNHRSPKQCRERWFNHLDSSVSTIPWTIEEDLAVFTLHRQLGPRWSIIAKRVPGRPDNAIKNRWNSSISKRIAIDSAGRERIIPELRKVAKRPNAYQIPQPRPAAVQRAREDRKERQQSGVQQSGETANAERGGATGRPTGTK